MEQMKVAERLLEVFHDPFLQFFRIEGLAVLKRYAEADQAVAAARQSVPEFPGVAVAEVALLMNQDNHGRTANAIRDAKAAFRDSILRLSSIPGFDEFSESHAGGKLLAERAGVTLDQDNSFEMLPRRPNPWRQRTRTRTCIAIWISHDTCGKSLSEFAENGED